MIIQIDTREHANEYKRIAGQFDKLGIKHFRSKLYVGDYQSLDNGRLVIDRKKDLLEVCSNVCQQHKRFVDEAKRAMDTGIKLVVLVEHGKGVQSIEDVYFWENPRSKIMEIRMINGRPRKVKKYPQATNGDTLCKIMLTLSKKYGVEWHFCDKRNTGKRIAELLAGGENVQRVD